MKKSLILVTLMLLFTYLGVAQVRTGNIFGNVVLEDGSAIPGVQVTLTSTKVGTMTTVTSPEGRYRFLSLPPARDYTVRAELEGFSTQVQKDIRVIIGNNVTVNLMMSTGDITQTIEVKGKPPVIDSMKTTAATNVTQEVLQSLPNARDPWAILDTAPSLMMDRQNVGGNESGQQARYFSRGEGRANSQWNVDGVDVTDPTAPGSSGMYYDFDMFEEMQIQTAANDVTAMTGGVNINFVTRRGSDEFSGGARFYLTDESLQADNTPSSLSEADLTGNRMNNLKDYGFNVGGPIVKQKIWFWGSYGVQDISLVDIRGDLDDTLLKTYNAKLNLSLGNHRIELYTVYNTKTRDGRKRYDLDLWEAARKQTGPAYIFKVQDEITIGNSLLISLKGAYTPTSYKLEPHGGRDIPVYEERRTYRWNTGTWEELDTDIYSASVLVNYFREKFLFGSHQIKLGLDYRSADSKTASQLGNGLQLVTRDNEAYYARVYRQYQLDYYTRRFSAYFQDVISLGKVNISLGLRYDRQSIGTRSFNIPGTNIPEVANVDGVNYNWTPVQQPGVDFPATFDFLSPRLGLIWDITGDSKTVVKFNFSIYGSALDSSYIDNYQVDSYHDLDWYDDNNNLLVDSGELAHYTTRDNYDALTGTDAEFFFDKNLKPEKDMEVVLGLERELMEDVLVGANFIYRRHYDINWTVPYVYDGGLRLVRPEDWSSYSADVNGKTYHYWDTYDADVYDEGVGKVMKRPDYSRIYTAIELTFRKQFSRGWMVNGSFIWQDTKINYDSRDAYIDPTDHEPNSFLDGKSGPHATDAEYVMNSRWMFKLNWLYRLPLGINFAGTFNMREGYIFPAVMTLEDEPRRWWSDAYPVVLLDEYGTQRYKTFYQIDLRLEKAFKLKKAGTFRFSLDAFNITNNDTILSKGNDMSLNTYNRPTRMLSPRIFRFGMRYEFR